MPVPNRGLVSPSDFHPESFVAPAPTSIASLIPGVELLELLGQGGMGARLSYSENLVKRNIRESRLKASGDINVVWDSASRKTTDAGVLLFPAENGRTYTVA
jgi:hypothetical protein